MVITRIFQPQDWRKVLINAVLLDLGYAEADAMHETAATKMGKRKLCLRTLVSVF